MSGEQQGTFRSDLRWCHEAVQGVSRTFALTVSELEAPMSHEICVGYLLCRIPDTIEDANHVPPDAQHDLLEQYSRVLDPDDDADVETFRADVDEWILEGSDDWDVVAQTPRVLRTFRELSEPSRRVITPAVRELTDGMAMFVGRYADVGGLRLRTFEELEEYCWYAAGTVGTLVTGLLDPGEDHVVDSDVVVGDEAASDGGASDDEDSDVHENARSFALLLQLVNVAKDVATDYREENNVYLPTELLADRGLAVEDIADSSNAERFAPIVGLVVDRAERYLDGAQAWLESMPEERGNTLSAWAIPFLLAVGTIRELERRPEDVIVEGNVKVPREEVHALLDLFASDDDPSVRTLRQKMRRAPLHEH